jgi:pyruvate/2-oxoglutarate dehydrogenase complex dihydrolipoamide acyltransferase (E2) component
MTTALKGEVTVREPTRAQQAIARRVAEAKATVPDVAVDAELEMEAVIALRRGWEAGEAPEVRDFIIKACGLALREFPTVNASYRDGKFELYSRVNIGMTVAADGLSRRRRSSTRTARRFTRSPARAARWLTASGKARSPRRSWRVRP